MRRILLTVLSLAALVLGLNREPDWRPPPRSPRTVAIVGDSVAYGAGDESRRGLAGHLAGVRVWNLGVNGARTRNVLGHLKRPDVSAAVRQADAVVVSIGGNDLFGDSRARLLTTLAPRLAIRRVSGRVKSVAAAVRGLNPRAQIYLLGLYNPYRAAWLDPLVTRWDGRLITLLATMPGVTVVRIADLLDEPDMLSPVDRFHPSASGYQAIATRIAASW